MAVSVPIVAFPKMTSQPDIVSVFDKGRPGRHHDTYHIFRTIFEHGFYIAMKCDDAPDGGLTPTE